MVLTSSTDAGLEPSERESLLRVARTAIGRGLGGAAATPPDVAGHTAALRAPAATFVTLECDGELRGCIGTLEPFQPLLVDTADNAYGAAYRDPRFPALTVREFERIEIQISILGRPEPLEFVSEEDLIAQLRPGEDGLILNERGRRATFLPAVWESVSDARRFRMHLKIKSGLPESYWSASIEVSRYSTVSIR